MEDKTPTFRFNDPSREWFRIVPSENGWDVIIPEDVTLTEAAQKFIEAVNQLKTKTIASAANKQWEGE